MVWNHWAVGAATPERGKNQFFLATCVYLIERLANPSRGGNLSMEWDAFSPQYLAAPDGIRSAITNGFFYTFQGGTSDENPTISLADRTTRTQETVVNALLSIAQEMTSDLWAIVSKLDYGDDSQKHLDAFNVLLASDDCRYPKDEVWFPAAVIELGSHGPDNPAFVPCAAIVLLNAIYDGDHVGHAEFRWEGNNKNYLDLESHHQSAIFAAFRHLHETLPYWSPFEARPLCKDPPLRWLIPWSP